MTKKHIIKIGFAVALLFLLACGKKQDFSFGREPELSLAEEGMGNETESQDEVFQTEGMNIQGKKPVPTDYSEEDAGKEQDTEAFPEESKAVQEENDRRNKFPLEESQMVQAEADRKDEIYIEKSDEKKESFQGEDAATVEKTSREKEIPSEDKTGIQKTDSDILPADNSGEREKNGQGEKENEIKQPDSYENQERIQADSEEEQSNREDTQKLLKEEHIHDLYEYWWYYPDCTSRGYYFIRCRSCDYEESGKDEAKLAPLGHIPDEGTVIKPPTCMHEGVMEHHCRICQAALEDTPIAVDENAHVWVRDEVGVYCDICNKEG